ncbi:MAG TPA: thioredoxin family protein [Thermomicrobiales bacterium]|nr:thioredoxin family protein [Thermomicrobiales bacterium]
MPISRERFESGLTPEAFADQMEVNKEKYLENIEANTFSDADLKFFKDHPVSIAAIGEDWCTDVIQFLPVVVKLAQESPDVTLKIFKRDDNHDLIDQYLKDGEFRSIPVFVAYDADWNELGHFIERPAEVTKRMGEETRRFAQENPHLEGATRTYANMPDETRTAVRANSSRFRWDNMAEWNRIFLDEFKAIVAGEVAAAR